MTCKLWSIDLFTHLDLVQNQNCCNFFSKMPQLYMVSKICSVKNFTLTSANRIVGWHKKVFIYLSVAFLKINCSNFYFGSNLKVRLEQSKRDRMTFWMIFRLDQFVRKSFSQQMKSVTWSVGPPSFERLIWMRLFLWSNLFKRCVFYKKVNH